MLGSNFRALSSPSAAWNALLIETLFRSGKFAVSYLSFGTVAPPGKGYRGLKMCNFPMFTNSYNSYKIIKVQSKRPGMLINLVLFQSSYLNHHWISFIGQPWQMTLWWLKTHIYSLAVLKARSLISIRIDFFLGVPKEESIPCLPLSSFMAFGSPWHSLAHDYIAMISASWSYGNLCVCLCPNFLLMTPIVGLEPTWIQCGSHLISLYLPGSFLK